MANNSNTPGQHATNNQYNIFINNLVIGPQQLRETLRGMMSQGFGAPANFSQARGTNQGLVTPSHVTGRKTATEVLPDDAVRANSNDQIKAEPIEVQYVPEGQAAPPPTVPLVPILENSGILPLPRDHLATSSNGNVQAQLTGKKRKTNDNMEDLVPPLKLASLAQNLTADAVKEDVTEPRHRVMLVNYKTSYPSSCQCVESKQNKYGFTFDKVRSNPETNTFFVAMKRYVTHISIASDEEMANIRRVLETEETKNFTWIHKFAVQRMQKPRAFFCPMVMNEEELMKCTVVATKAYMEKRNGNEVGAMELNEMMNSSELLKNAMECQETMKQLDEGLNKKGKTILKALIKKCTGTR